MKKQYNVDLKDEERNQLKKMTEKGSEKGRKIKRAQILLLADKGKKDQEIAEWLDVTMDTVQRIRKRYATEGLESAIAEKARSGRPTKIKAETRAKITALACSEAPEGRTRWTLRLF
jgi:transposase